MSAPGVPDLPAEIQRALRETLEGHVDPPVAAAAVRAINQYCRDYHARVRMVREREARWPRDARWLRAVRDQAVALEALLAQRIKTQENGAVVAVAGQADVVALHSMRLHAELGHVIGRIDAALPALKIRKGGLSALIFLDAAVADVLDQIKVPLKQGESTLSQVLEDVHAGIGLPKPKHDTRGRNSAQRAIKNLAWWRSLPAHEKGFNA